MRLTVDRQTATEPRFEDVPDGTLFEYTLDGAVYLALKIGTPHGWAIWEGTHFAPAREGYFSGQRKITRLITEMILR